MRSERWRCNRGRLPAVAADSASSSSAVRPYSTFSVPLPEWSADWKTNTTGETRVYQPASFSAPLPSHTLKLSTTTQISIDLIIRDHENVTFYNGVQCA